METIRVAKHEVCQQDETLFVFRFGEGAVSAAELRELSDLERRAWHQPHLYNIIVFPAGLSISAGLIPQAVTLMRNSPPRTTAFVAPVFALRTYMEFLSRALRQVGIEVNSRFFEDERTAREWIEERRREYGRTSSTKA